MIRSNYDTKYINPQTPTVVASGIEARLIRAEVALHNNAATWIDTLNVLRNTVGLGPLSAPVSDTGKVNMLYSERGFWLYLTARRLGDLRRLIRIMPRSRVRISDWSVLARWHLQAWDAIHSLSK